MTDTLTLYAASVPVLDRLLSNLEHVLKKGEADAKARKIDEGVFVSARLAPDMAALSGQVDIFTSLVKAGPFRLSGQTPPVYGDMDAGFSGLYARIAQARKDIHSVEADAINGREHEAFSLKMGPNERDFTGLTYLNGFLLPNLYFHLTMAYAILRHNGVALGKLDYFGGPDAA